MCVTAPRAPKHLSPSQLSSTSHPTDNDAAGAPHGPDLYTMQEQFRETLCADVPIDLANVMYSTHAIKGLSLVG